MRQRGVQICRCHLAPKCNQLTQGRMRVCGAIGYFHYLIFVFPLYLLSVLLDLLQVLEEELLEKMLLSLLLVVVGRLTEDCGFKQHEKEVI